MELTDAKEQLEMQRQQIQGLQKKYNQLLQEEEDDLEFVWSVPMRKVKVCPSRRVHRESQSHNFICVGSKCTNQ